MRCPNCEVESGPCTKFCPECGNGLLPLTSAKTCQSRKDDGTICGQVLQDGVKFCPSCGKPVEKIITCRHCNSNLVANASFCQNCGKPVSDTKKKIPEQDIQQRQGDLVAPSEERKAPGASNEEEFGSISFIDADGAPETIPKGTEHDDNDSSQSEEEEWFDTKNEVDETNEEGRLTQDSPRPDGEDETKQELQLQAGDDTPQKDTKTEISIESANTKNNSEDEVQHVEITVSKKANDSTENFGNLYKQPAMGLETDVDSFKQSIIYQAVEENWIRISFHALIAPNMKFEHQNDIVVLHMWTKNGNGGTVNWKKPMTFEGTHLEVQGVAEVKFEVDLPKSDVFNARISYKYYVERNSMKPDGTKRKDVWECLYGNKSDNDRRQLLVNKSSEGLGYWHQYDGFIYKKTKPKKPKEAGGFMKSLKSGYEYVIGTNATDRDKDPEIVLRVFGGQIANMWSKMYQLPHLVDMIKNMSYQLFICTESIYSFGKNWRTIRQQVNQTLWKTFTDCYKSLQDGSSDEDIKRKTCLSIVMLYIRKLTCTKTDEQALQFLCSCFLVHSDGSKQRVREYDVLLQHFSNKDRDELKSELVLLVCEMTSQVSKDPSWWYLLPILHFLSRTCAPFEEVSHNANHAAVKPYWWGLMITEDFEKIKNRYMYNQHRPKIHPHTIIRKMRSLFTADYYLPRSIVASLTLDEIEELIKDSTMIPHEVFFAAMYFFMVSEQETSTKVTKCLDALLNQVQVQKMESDCKHLHMKVSIAKDMLIIALSTPGIDKWQQTEYGIKMYLYCMAFYDKAVLDKNGGDEIESLPISLEEIASLVIHQLDSRKKYTFGRQIDLWDRMLYPGNFPEGDVKKRWNKTLCEALEGRMEEMLKQSKIGGHEIVFCYCRNINSYQQPMQKFMASYVSKVLGSTSSLVMKNLSETDRYQLRQLMLRTFNTHWQNVCNRHDGKMDLKMLCNWANLPLFLSILDPCDINEQQDRDILTNITNVLESSAERIVSGSILIWEMTFVLENTKRFLDLLEFTKFKDNPSVAKAISVRLREKCLLSDTLDDLQNLKSFCISLETVDLKELDELLKANLAESKLSDVIVVASVEIFSDENSEIKLARFDVNKDIREALTYLRRYKESLYFRKLWERECSKQEREKVLTLTDIYQAVVAPVLERMRRISLDIAHNTISFTELEAEIGMLYPNNFENLQTELATICDQADVSKIQYLVRQIKNYRHVVFMRKVAMTLMIIKDTYDVHGDFGSTEDIRNIELDKLDVATLTDDFYEKCSLLADITQEQHACLQAFSKCSDLVVWLRKSMGDSQLKELKVFVDLAMMSAGDNVEKAERVQCLHAAVTGYSSLIFDLQNKGGILHLLQMCQPVWKELSNTENIHNKLEDASRYIEWFKNIKSTHGAVEVTSYMQAETINEHGVYMIGKSVLERFDVEVDQNISRDDDKERLLGLLIPASLDGHRDAKQYKFSELQDLQSRLMLVGGESEQIKHCIDRFSVIFDGVIRLCNIYKKLVSSGCVLFRDFSIQVYCNPSPERPVCFVLEFRNRTKLSQLKCHKTADELIENMMPKVATQMENCLSEWLNFVNSKRTDFPHLNFYTTDQLVILQKEIAHMMNNGEPSSDLYPLLHLRKNQCTLDDIETTNKDTTDKIQREDLLKNEDEEVPDNTKKAKSSAKEVFIQKVIKAGCKDMLPYALDEFRNNLKPSSALAWCISNRSRIDELKATYRAKQLEKGMTDKYDMDTSYDAMIASAVTLDSNTVRCDEMLKKLVLIWKKFLESASSNLSDYVSLKHLGIFLELLGNKEDESFQRRLPSNYSTEAPNLIICPSHELLQATVSLYMTDQNQMLPQADEVVTCSPSTSLEEVDILLRRAIFSSNGKIHCLVHADLLGYIVWEETEKRLAEYLRNKDSTARIGLVIICSSENEHTSAVVSSLDRYKREYKPLNDTFVSSCIAEKLKFSDRKSASAVDLQSSTVRVIRSKRSGVGKTLYKKRKEETLKRMMKTEESLSVTLSLHGKHIDVDKIIGLLLPHARLPGQESPRIIHIDVANEVYAKQELDYMLFNLLILGRVITSTGLVWKKNHLDLYLIERLEMISSGEIPENACQIFRILPCVTCLSPQDCLDVYEGTITPDPKVDDQLFDQMLFESDLYQKTYIYLKQLERGVKNINIRSSFRAASPSKSECLKTLLRQCRVKNPSWSELYHFVLFLRTQLRDFERNVFVSDVLANELPGFSTFVLKFLLQMSQDFSSRSLNMGEENAGEVKSDEDLLKAFKIRRTWESSPHPYIFFNADGQTFTFLGFYIDPETMDLIDQQTNEPLERSIMHHRLYDALLNNQVPIQENFDHLDRSGRIERLCRVMDMPIPETDPDETYELTTDNAKKIMAIYMRFRCDIPVIVMGETGCGKTRLVKFMCDLMNPKQDGSTNMIIMKVHGGTTDDDIKEKVKEAENIARENRKRGIVDVMEEKASNKKEHCEKIDGDMNMKFVEDVSRASEKRESVHVSANREETIDRNVYTVLFFDEANTTESIGLIKEIMCDKTMDGKPLNLCENLKIVAACNPYRRHPKKLIKKLERAGLGYANPEKTTDVLGRIAMRQLVYRVQPLPPSLLPFVWDFGQLNASVEKLYIVQMVKRYIRQNALPDNQKLTEVISTILAQSQEYMRGVEDECCFVSLRDVDRVLKVMCWFLSLYIKKSQLFVFMGKKLSRMHQNFSQDKKLDTITRCLVLAVGVCYHASLTDRDKYRKHIANYFREPCLLPFGPEQILHEIDCCQEVILDNVNLEDNIAQNLALKENVFMMVVCIELRIPLFLVGKPGSSKSLAKVVVTDAMQGNASHHQLFKEFKQVQMVSFQCSPLSTPHGIVSTFRQCAMFQRQKNLDTFVSAVVLDEIGLAEDSPSMPLKTLHPLLEYGYEDDDIPAEEKKVAFIGISNWALDPAKMNRGIFVQRDIPDCDELENTAKGICAVSERIPGMHQKIIKPLAAGYLEVFDLAVRSKAKREFFGLRDFYCLMKMINRFVDRSNRLPSFHQMVYAVQRNFSGLEFETDDLEDKPLDIFMNKTNLKFETQRRNDDPAYDLPALIKSCLTDKGSGSRHMLLLTENYNALATFQQKMLKSSIKQIVIFGSSFRRDQEYTQVCRNINRIKLCMETGYTVMLLNSESLYESLYDALNQYYVSFGGQRFVDLGLGRHRVKCPVHDDFKLIIVAEKQVVYKEFPIPLINRLEKHILTSNTLLTNEQNEIVEDVKDWAIRYVSEALSISENDVTEKDIGKVFIGYHEDACSAIVLALTAEVGEVSEEKSRIVQEAKEALTWCSTPDAVVRLGISKFPDWENVQNVYWKRQSHECITQYLHYQFKEKKCKKLFAQVTTHGKLLVASHLTTLSATTGIPEERILLLESLTAFDTEQQFNSKIRKHLDTANGNSSLLIIQCESGDTYANLIACARYSVLDECEKYRKKHCQTNQKEGIEIHVLIIIQMPTQTNGNFRSIQCGDWHSAHIDHLLTASIAMPSIVEMQGRSIGFLVKEAMNVQIKHKEEAEAESKGAVAEDQSDVIEHKVTVDLRSILSTCIHGAMSRVRDAENNGYRTTQRISLLLLLLQNSVSNDAMSFLHGLSVQISRLLEDKEKNTSNPQTSDNWLAKKAASQDVIQKTGTLRRACLQVFGSVITPILSGLIAFLDTNQNLNILQMEKLTWQFIVWLTVLKTDDAIPLSYRDMFQDGNSETQREFHVVCTGSNGKIFQSKMPFSWLIYQKIEEVLRRKPALSDIANVAEIFAETPIGSTLICVPQNHIEEMIDCYIHDFVHMEYTFEKPKECIVVCEFLKAKTFERAENNSVTLTDVHLAYRDISDSLKYFRQINHTWDQCSKVIKDDVVKSLQTPDITIKALYLMIEDISRKTEDEYDLAEQAGREEWLNNVHNCRHIIQQTLAHCLKEKEQMEIEKNNLLHIRSMWNRVVVLQLFLEDVCTAHGEERITVDISMVLWESLDEEDDMKNIETLEKLEKFLTACYETAKTVYVSKADKCSKCEKALHHDRKRLHCGHKICECCLQELLSLKKGQQTCFTCKQKLPDGWENLEDSVETDTPDRLQDYQKRCNTFFMDVVSQLCFSEGQAPSEKVVDRLMNYSLQYGNGAENVATGVDPDDAFKAFILKHLIMTNEKGLKERVNKYLNELQRTSAEECLALDEKRTNSLLLVVCCIEDNLNERFSCSNVSDAVLAAEVLNVSYQLLEKGSSLVDKVYGVANARTGLGIVAKYICDLVCQKRLHENKSKDGVTLMLQSAKKLCSLHWPWKYLVKCIFNIGGTDALLTACKTKDSSLNWLYNENVMKDKVTDAIDMYLCCGDLYMTIRQNLMEAVRIGNADIFLERLEQLPQMHPEYRKVLFELALHREIILPKSTKHITRNEEVLKKIAECCSGTEEEFTKRLTTNEFEGTPFLIDGNEPDLHVSVKCLIFHWCRVLSHVNKDSLPKPVRHLKDLAEDAGQFSDAFLPTMPQDDIADLRDILQKTAKESKEYDQDENPTLYICPNGHPYEVRDYGRPFYIGTCLCGATIGGKSHKLKEDNSMDTGIDKTKVGHILGKASGRNDGPVPERSLSRLYSASTRIVLHLAMCSSCCKDTQVICSLINPPVKEKDIFRFLFEHLLKDLEDLQLVLSCNVDDVLILFHHLANNLMQIEETDFEDNIDELSWLSKEGRRNWEITFADLILKPLFENSQSALAEIKIRLQGSNALLRMVAEAEVTERSMAALENLEEESKLWNYRAPITLHSLTKEFERKALMDKQNVNHQFLRAFLSDVTILQAIRFIPNVLKLHRSLMNRYCYKLYRNEATSITVGKLREDRIAAEETDILIDDTIKAWDIIRKELKGHVLTTEDRRLAVPREISEVRITDTSPISILLPSTEGQSLCTYAMLDLLVRHQNAILEKYKMIYGHKGKMLSVLPRDLTVAHVVSFDPQYDIQPLILANCTLHMENVTVEYDFGGIERQLIDRFISTKSMISLQKYLKIDLMVYRTDMKDAESLEKIEALIPQEELDGRYATQICSEIIDIPSLCQILEALDIAISFLNITGGNATRYLNEYMEKTLEMDSSAVLTQKIQQICQLRHIKSLWMNISFKKSMLMVADGKTSKDVFEIVPDVFHVPLPDDQYEGCNQFLLDSKDDDLDNLLEVLFKYLVLHLTRRERENDAEFPLKSCLEKVSDQCTYPSLLERLQSKHSAQLWTTASQILLERKDGQ